MASHGVRGLRGLLAGSEIICRQLLALEHDDDLEFFGAKFLVDPILYFPKTRLLIYTYRGLLLFKAILLM